MDNRSVGVFDSGLGGLSFVRRLNSLLPSENVVYLGDTARVPYGSRTPEDILNYTLQDMAFLRRKNVKVIVAACGTASSAALPAIYEAIIDGALLGGESARLMNSLDFSAEPFGDSLRLLSGGVPVLGVVDSAAHAACRLCVNGRIGILGTESTIRSGAYSRAVSLINADFECFSVACPLFVPLVENGYTDHPATKIIAEEYLSPLIEADVDTIILGCTHYPLLRGLLESITDGAVEYVDSGGQAAEFTAQCLQNRDMLSSSHKGENHFFVTDNTDGFASIGARFLGSQGLDSVQKVSVDCF